MKVIISYFVMILSILFCIVSLIEKKPHLLLVATTFITVAIILSSLSMKNFRIGYLIFTCSIFVFLLSRTFSNAFDGSSLEQYFSDEMSFKGIFYILISLYTLYIGQYIFSSKKLLLKQQFTLQNQENNITRALLVCKVLFYIGAFCEVIMLVVRIILVRKVGYVGSYLEMANSVATVPYIITKFADFYVVSFIVMLAMLPRMEKIKRSIIIFVLIASLSLFTGSRNGFFVPMVFLIWYFYYRKSIGIESWNIKRKTKLWKVILLAYLGTIIIGIVGIVRVDGNINATIFNPFKTIAENIGGSNLVLLRTFTIENDIPEEYKLSFLFGPFYNFANNNTISQIVFGTQIDPYGSTKYALNGFNFGSYLTYKNDVNFYLSGGGFGSSYIAEAYVAGGVLGIFLVSFFYSFFISLPYRIKKNNWVIRSILFYMMYWFFYTPRDAALYFLTAGLNITNILIILAVWLSSKLPVKQTNRLKVDFK